MIHYICPTHGEQEEYNSEIIDAGMQLVGGNLIDCSQEIITCKECGEKLTIVYQPPDMRELDEELPF